MPLGGSSSSLGGGKGHTQNRCYTTATCQASRGSVGSNTGGAHGGGDEYEVQDPTRSCIHYHALAGSLVYGKYMYENEYLRKYAYVAKKTCTKILKDCL